MHRESLSRSLLFSQVIGKSLAPLNYRGGNVVLFGKIPQLQVQSATHYHRSWSNAAASAPPPPQSVTKSILTEKGSTPPSKFNLKAKDILDTPDDGISPPHVVKTDNLSEDNVISQLDSKIFSSRSIEQLLTFSQAEDLTLKHACVIVGRLGQLSLMRPEVYLKAVQGIREDKRFIRLFNLIQRGNHAQYPQILLQALTGLQKLGLANTPEVTCLLERELSWSMRRCPLRFLAKSVGILNNNLERSAKDEGILRQAIQVLNRRWIEAITGSDFISLFKVINLFEPEVKQKIEERTADVAHQFSKNEIAKIFIVLGSKKRRPTPLLRALSFHFTNSEQRISAKETIDMVYALNELTFADPILMNRVCTDLAEEVAQVKNTALISSLMTSLGQMRYKQKDILFAVDEWISKHLSSLRVFDFACWLQAAATLGHQSDNLPAFCEKAELTLSGSNASSSPTEWTNIVHSFVILNHCSDQLLQSVLNSKFLESIVNLGVVSNKQKVKLLNLNEISKRRQSYNGPLIPEELVKEWTATVVTSSDPKLSKLVVESLNSFLPAERYLELDCQMECGVFVDAKLYVDSKLKPVTLESVDRQLKTGGLRQVCFYVEAYPLVCLGLKHPTGHSLLNRRLLENENCVVIPVPYTELSHSDKLVRRVQYLEQKLKHNPLVPSK